MGFHFRRRIRLAPGIHLNLSKSGISTSLGGHGLTVNLGRGKTRTTVGLPGTGLSYSTTADTAAGTPSGRPVLWLLLGLVVVAIVVWLA